MRRENELTTSATVWGAISKAGDEVFRHSGDIISARRIVSHLIQKRATIILRIQQELVDERRRLVDTDIGRELDEEFAKRERETHQKLETAKTDLDSAISRGDNTLVDSAVEEQDELESDLRAIESSRLKLQDGAEDLYRGKARESQMLASLTDSAACAMM